MLAEIGNVLTQFISWVGEVVTSLVTAGNGSDIPAGALHSLLPLFVLGIGISVFMVIFKAIRKVTWGA